MAKYIDIADKAEDERIRQIGAATMAASQRGVAFVTDSDPGKIERYIEKLLKRFPGIEVVKQFKGPVRNAVSCIVRRKQAIHESN